MSSEERIDKGLTQQSEFTYGEVIFADFIPALEFVKPISGEVFLDLGCGAGKPLFTTALAFPKLKECRGIEITLKDLYVI